MGNDLFDDDALRRAFERALDLQVCCAYGEGLGRRWYFRRRKLGLVQLEMCPLGFYAAVCGDEAQLAGLLGFLKRARRPPAGRVRIHLNPLETHRSEILERAAALGYRARRLQTHIVRTGPSIDQMRSAYHATKRYESLRVTGIPSEILVASEARHLRDYLEAYRHSLERWGRRDFIYPPALFEGLMSSPSVKIWMNYVLGRLACAMVVIYCERFAFYWQGVSRVDEDQKRAYPVVKLMDAVLQDMVESGIPCLNMGASDGLPNIRKFKEGFGAQPSEYISLEYASVPWLALAGAGRLVRRWGARSQGAAP
jgi:hypothetical protein